jgi:hypothetical protein
LWIRVVGVSTFSGEVQYAKSPSRKHDRYLPRAWSRLENCTKSSLEHTQFDGAEFIETKVYNSHRYHLGSLEGAKVKDVDPSPDASGLKQSGVEALQFLQAS